MILIDQIDFDDTAGTNPYILEIHAVDNPGNNPSNTGTTTFTVDISDVNDNSPICSPAIMSLAIPESTPGSSSIVTLTCSDLDSGMNKDLNYSITFVNNVPLSTLFQIDTSGEVTTAPSTVLDYENTTAYTILIGVKDNGSVSKSFTATVNVGITDVNESPPVFKATPYLNNVQENIAIGSSVYVVTTIDHDSADIVTYSISPNNAYFKIDPLSGIIYTIAQIDYDALPSATIVLTVNASDGLHQVSENVNLTITNLNDGIPVFTPSVYAVSIPENTTEQTTVVTVTVSDLDDTSFLFNLKSGNIGNVFDVISNGTFGHIYLKDDQSFDYDTQQKSYVLVVQAVDGSATHTATATVVIQVTNINEFPPVVSPSSRNSPIPENSAIGTVVDTVTATDNDDGIDGDISYSITMVTNNGVSQFTINPTNGVVSLAGTLDRETQATYEMEILAVDAGITPGNIEILV